MHRHRRRARLGLIILVLLALSPSLWTHSQGDTRELTLFRDRDSLTLYIPGNTRLSLRGLFIEVSDNQGVRTRYSFEAYPEFTALPFDALPTPLCLRLQRQGSQSVAPQECRALPRTRTLTSLVSDGNVFWYDALGGQGTLLLVLLGDQDLDLCPPQEARCPIFLPVVTTPTPDAPATQTPGPTSTPPNRLIGGGGGKLAYIRNGDVWVAYIDGTDAVAVFTSSSEEAVPAWSPDGTRIAFRSNRDGNSEIYVIDEDGANLTRLTVDNAVDTNPTWSPDGRYLAYRSLRDGNAEIKLLDTENLDRPSVNLSKNSANDYTPDWSLTGNVIVFTSNRGGNYDLWKMDPDGGGQRQVTANGAANYTPSVSPDGQRVVFATDKDPEGGYAIYLINIDGTEQSKLFGDGKFNMYPQFSPDGKWILFSAGRNARGNDRKIYVMNEQGAALQFVVDGDQPAWQP
jgi:Tol biopolymer transport system component